MGGGIDTQSWHRVGSNRVGNSIVSSASECRSRNCISCTDSSSEGEAEQGRHSCLPHKEGESREGRWEEGKGGGREDVILSQRNSPRRMDLRDLHGYEAPMKESPDHIVGPPVFPSGYLPPPTQSDVVEERVALGAPRPPTRGRSRTQHGTVPRYPSSHTFASWAHTSILATNAGHPPRLSAWRALRPSSDA